MMCKARHLAFLVLSVSMQVGAIRIAYTESVDDVDIAIREADDADAGSVVTPDYWSTSHADERCRDARSGRKVRRVFGRVVGWVVAAPMAIATSVATVANVGIYVVGANLGTVAFLSVHAAPLAAAWAAFMSWRGGVLATQVTSDVVARMFGKDGHKPVCCCVIDPANFTEVSVSDPPANESMCAMVGSSSALGWRAECLEGMVHAADQCDSVEPALTYSKTTVGGCECFQPEKCESNKFHRGHAWCAVKMPRDCSAYRFKINRLKHWKAQSVMDFLLTHWDYCKVEKRYIPEANITVNEFVSQFGINLDRASFRLDPRSVFTWGSYVDTSKALVIAPVKVFGEDTSVCLPGELEETLDGCAQRCIEDGATVVGKDGATYSKKIACVAFAYNHLLRQCVRLPEEATGALFKPYQRNPSLPAGVRDGWQNFRLLLSNERDGS